MQLFGSLTSPYVRHCRIALNQGERPWTMEIADYAFSGANSPTKKVPFLKDGALLLSDSTAILAEVRQQQGRDFLASTRDWEIYCTASTALDTAINIYLLEQNGVVAEHVPYLARQADRLSSCLDYLESLDVGFDASPTDAQIRLACFLGWGQFRRRFEFSNHISLTSVCNKANQWSAFTETAPPT